MQEQKNVRNLDFGKKEMQKAFLKEISKWERQIPALNIKIEERDRQIDELIAQKDEMLKENNSIYHEANFKVILLEKELKTKEKEFKK